MTGKTVEPIRYEKSSTTQKYVRSGWCLKLFKKQEIAPRWYAKFSCCTVKKASVYAVEKLARAMQ
jgi:hypothetical protein